MSVLIVTLVEVGRIVDLVVVTVVVGVVLCFRGNVVLIQQFRMYIVINI